MKPNLSAYIEETRSLINQTLLDFIKPQSIPNPLRESMIYSIEAGGKRIRPILMIACCQAFGGNLEKVLPVAAALEMIHTYSLIHDDLPAMDDDDLRRGRPTNHIQFNEATAILAGDGLLTLSFQMISQANQLTDNQKVYVIQRLSEASGITGMVAGQMLDIELEDQDISIEQLEEIHQLKTGQLFIYAMEIGAYLADAPSEKLTDIIDCATQLGLVFQIQDDILDITGDQVKLGKTIGSDLDKNKSTYPKLLGLSGAIQQKEIKINQAKRALEKAGISDSILAQLIEYLSDREQ
ncbi:polyprenyl synthetase family protein [Amphibacillus sediminis]|uniref:polyprenyl synthetase family protein n=1 Tax=Amphibacillus sediminis TaxID=360185 RepID=UPI000832E9B5|nr:farnesyl diphosphate synthase [Amphibacillus sediminis]